MLKQLWIAECDLCGNIERAKEIPTDNGETRYILPFGWAWGVSDIKCAVCPECLRTRRRFIYD